MAKQFYTTGEGSSQTLNQINNEVIKIYTDKAAADLDLANIEENEIVATKAGESEGVVEIVDTVEEDNPNAVSSGAVYDYIKGVDYDLPITGSQITSGSVKATKIGRMVFLSWLNIVAGTSVNVGGNRTVIANLPDELKPLYKTAGISADDYANYKGRVDTSTSYGFVIYNQSDAATTNLGSGTVVYLAQE